jgi:hypothetical protein
MRTFLVVVSLALVGWSTIGVANPVFADGPQFTGPEHEEGTAPILDCGSFTVLDHYVLNFTEKRFTDQNGNLVKILEEVYGTDTLINSVTGKSYTGKYHNTVSIDPTTHTGATTGIIFRIVVPGSGAVFLDVGRIVANRTGVIFTAGPHQAFDGDIAGLCAALS